MDFIKDLAQRLPSTEFYSNLPFWVYFVLICLGFRLVPSARPSRSLVLLGANLFMLLMLPAFNVLALALYGFLAGATFLIGYLLRVRQNQPKTSRVGLTVAGIVLVLLVLATFKYRHLQSFLIRDKSLFGRQPSDFVFLIGISYSSFKAIHFMLESFKGTIKQARFLDYLNYLLFFPSFVSGPINRFNDFLEKTSAVLGFKWRDDLAAGGERIIHGLFKKFVITTILLPHTLIHIKTPLAEMAAWEILVGLYVYALYFYFDFSAYSDLAIGSGRLLGFVLPENFDYPFLKKNIQQLWANWHMSLTSWLTDYIYWPIVRKLRNYEAMRRNPLLISNIAIITTFFLCGAWHGETVNFLLWGLYHGFGIAMVNVYQKYKRQVRKPWALKYFSSRLSYWIGVVATFHFFTFGLLFLLNLQQVKIVLGKFF